MDPEIAIAVSAREWGERLHRFVADHGGARVRVRVLQPLDALEEAYQVLVIDDIQSFLTPRFVEDLRRSGRRLLGVYDPEEPAGKDRLLELGAHQVVEATASPEEFLEVIQSLAGPPAELFEELVEGIEPPPPEPARPEDPWRGRLTVVGGASGGTGATEVSLALAEVLARRGESAVVVDADDQAPSLAQRLGLDLYPNLRTAIDAVQHRTGRLADVLVPVPAGGFEAVAGLPNPKDWFELHPPEVVRAARELTGFRRHVVVNIGHRLEELASLGGLPRNALARTMVGSADVLLGVGHPSPVGIARLLEWVAEVRGIGTEAPIHLAVNRVGPGTFVRGEAEEEIRRTFRPAGLAFLPEDRKVERACWAGELVPRGPFVKAVEELAEVLLPPLFRRRRRRGVRLALRGGRRRR